MHVRLMESTELTAEEQNALAAFTGRAKKLDLKGVDAENFNDYVSLLKLLFKDFKSKFNNFFVKNFDKNKDFLNLREIENENLIPFHDSIEALIEAINDKDEVRYDLAEEVGLAIQTTYALTQSLSAYGNLLNCNKENKEAKQAELNKENKVLHILHQNIEARLAKRNTESKIAKAFKLAVAGILTLAAVAAVPFTGGNSLFLLCLSVPLACLALCKDSSDEISAKNNLKTMSKALGFFSRLDQKAKQPNQPSYISFSFILGQG